jgi:hypothetical protein
MTFETVKNNHSFLSAMSLPRTSKDLNSCPSFLALPQNLNKNINSFHVPYSNKLAKFLPKIPQRKSSQKNPPKNSSEKISKKIPPK